MQAVTITARRFFENGKAYLTKQTPFKDKHPFEKRLLESSRIMEKYPNRIPVICECVGGEVPDIAKLEKKLKKYFKGHLEKYAKKIHK
jgi:hypothetical protein